MENNLTHEDRIYLGEISQQCDFSLKALRYMYQSFVSNNEDFWYHVQSFLSATANINKLLNAKTDSKYYNHHENIKTKYEIPDFDFNNERIVRNKVEHIDEELVKWMKKSKDHNFDHRNIASKGAIGGNIDFFINFAPDTNVISFSDIEFDSEVTFNKVKSIKERIEEIL